MSQDKNFLHRWKTEIPKTQEISLPSGFAQRMQEKAFEQWGVSIALDEGETQKTSQALTFSNVTSAQTEEKRELKIATLSEDSVIVSLAKWKKEHPKHSKILKAKLRAGGLHASTKQAVGHGAFDTQKNSYATGDLLTLDVQGPMDDPLYITILLRRGSEPIQLAYPYGPDDNYKPMRRLELEWEIEIGPQDRTFLILLSQEPLLDLSAFVSPDQNVWSDESILTAIPLIPWKNVLHINEISFLVI